MSALPRGHMLVRFGVLVAAWLALTGLLIGVGFAIVHSSAINGFDHRVTARVVAHRSDALNAAMKVVTWFGSWVALVVTGVVVLVLAVRGWIPWLAALLAVVAWAGE